MAKWVRTTATKYGNPRQLYAQRFSPGEPLTIMPTADADQMLRLLRLARKQCDPALGPLGEHIDAFLAARTSEGSK